MKFTIALYGSFEDSAGYTWKLPRGYDAGQFDRIASHFSERHIDGRQLGERDLYGGYYIDVRKDLFFAFRFIDGGRDALGRAGVVITDWAMAPYSEVKGRDLRNLFDALTLKRMPVGETIDVDLPLVFDFGGTGGAFWSGSDRVLRGEAVKSVFRLPAVKCPGNTLVQFTVSESRMEASVQFVSSAPESPRPVTPPEPTAPPRSTDDAVRLRPPRAAKVLPLILLFIPVVLVFGGAVWWWFHREPDAVVPPLPPGPKPIVPGPRAQLPPPPGPKPIGPGPRAQLPPPPPAEKVIKGSWTIWTPTAFWYEREKVNGLLSHLGVKAEKKPILNKTNRYTWGELRVDRSRVEISFSERIVLKRNGDEYDIMSGSDRIGVFKIRDNELLIRFNPKDSRGKYELTGNFSLYDERDPQSLAELSINENGGSIRLSLDRLPCIPNDWVPEEKIKPERR